MIDYSVNAMLFDAANSSALQFFGKHGYVVLANVFAPEETGTANTAFDEMRHRFAGEMRLSTEKYDERICQWRDLWMTEPYFNDLLNDARLHGAAQAFMQEDSVQLLHDHIIRKPYDALNDTVPWHQDFPFWPVDTPNSLSCWVPFEDVSECGGCLEVIDGSHLWGISPPVDFIMDAKEFGSRDDIIRIPVPAGSIVILNSLTWHRTNPNEDSGTNRPAYITLWIPAHARYRPDLAGWHPVNEHVTVESGQHLNTDKFPRFGEFNRQPSDTDSNTSLHEGPLIASGDMDTFNMFNATAYIAYHIHRITGDWEAGIPRKNLGEYLIDERVRERVVCRSFEQGIINAEKCEWMKTLFDRLLVNSSAFQMHRARNIYNDAYVEWWLHVGSKWVELWEKRDGMGRR